MYEYSHGGNAAFENNNADSIDLSASINPLGMPKHIPDAIIREIQNCNRYPDNASAALRQRIAEFEQVPPDWIFCSNGASDSIFRLPRATHSKKVLVTAPTFSDYERASRSYGSTVVRYALSADRGFAVDAGIIDAVQRENPDLVFLCNPNNPTGSLAEPGLIRDLLECCHHQGAWLALDECFLDFADCADAYTGKPLLAANANLIIIKAFTKLFALPGIRLGYTLSANERLLDALYFHGADWPLSNLAQAAGIAALEYAETYIAQTVDYVSTERRKIEKELARLGYRIFESKANYVFLQNPYRFDLKEELDKEGIRIRTCDNFYGLDSGYYRIAVSTPHHNSLLLEAIAKRTAPFQKDSKQNAAE